MEPSTIFQNLNNPDFYDIPVQSVKILQTHISYVALTGRYAYKIKKPVNFGFLDFSTLEKRKFFCEEELRLNKRLCPEIYLGVLPITKQDHKLHVNGKGEIIEYTLKMKEFSQDTIMTHLLQKGKITEKTMDELCDILVDFYSKDIRTNEKDSYGAAASVKKNIDENFEQTRDMVGVTIDKDMYEMLQTANQKFFSQHKAIFEQRIQDGRIHDCHGDLHSGNIVVDKKINIFDCIEFNNRFRYCDVASDIGFLAMDLDYLNHPYLSSYLIIDYVRKSGDTDIFSVLNFYKSYRAYVRGKVIGFQLNDPHVEEEKKKSITTLTKNYFRLARYYAELFSLNLVNHGPFIFVVCGLSGTGKSTVAQKIAIDYHAEHINTDIVRKEQAGIDVFERHHDQINTGLYDPKKVDETYEKVMEKAATILKKGGNVVLDATFQKKNTRALASRLAKNHHATLFIIQCVCPDDIVKQRLEERIKKKSVSDGRWEIYLNQKKTFEPFTSEELVLTMDTSDASYEYRMEFFTDLVHQVQQVI